MAPRVLVLGPVSQTPLVDGLVAALRDELIATGRRVDVRYRGFPEDRHDPLLDVAAGIDHLRPAVIVGWGARCARYWGYAHHPPVVFVVGGDPAS